MADTNFAAASPITPTRASTVLGDTGSADGPATVSTLLGLTNSTDINMAATSRIVGRVTASAGKAEELTAAQVKTLLAILSTDLSDFTEAVQDILGAMIVAAGGSYNDGAGSITLPSGGSVDDYDIVSASPTSTYQASGLTGHTVVKLSLGGNTAVSPPATSTFGSSKRFFVIYELTASGGARTPSFTSHTVVGGVSPVDAIASGDMLVVVTYTDDNGSSFNIVGALDLTKLTTKATLVSGDYVIVSDSAASNVQKKHAAPAGAIVGTTETQTLSNKVFAGGSPNVNAQTGTTYTTQDSDNGKIITCSNAGAITVTIHQGAAAGFNCLVVQKGAGQVSFAAGGTGAIRNRQSHTKIAGQYGAATIYVDSNAGTAPQVYLAGDTAA